MKRRRSKLDRMDHPVSHTAAVFGAVAFLGVLGCAILGLQDARMLQVPAWWAIFFISSGLFAIAITSYFAPGSRWSLVPVCLTGLIAGWCAVVATVTRFDHWLIVSAGPLALWLVWAMRQWTAFRTARANHRSTQSPGM